MKCRRCGVIPGKAMDDDKQRQALKVFHDQLCRFLTPHGVYMNAFELDAIAHDGKVIVTLPEALSRSMEWQGRKGHYSGF